jgi:hypothetical protein
VAEGAAILAVLSAPDPGIDTQATAKVVVTDLFIGRIKKPDHILPPCLEQ